MQKKLIHILLFISLLGLTFSCQTESYDFLREDGSIEILQDGRLRVPIQLYIPVREVVETKSAPGDEEKAIKSVDVCVFDANGNVVEKVKGEIDPTDALRVFVKLLPYKDPCKVQFYANIPAGCRDAFNKATKQTEIDALIMSEVIFEKDSVSKNGLPLLSVLDSYTALNSSTLKKMGANLKFAYARIDISNQAEEFKLTSLNVLNLRQNSYLTEKDPLASPDVFFQSAETTQLTGIYLFESPGPIPTDLLIRGTKTGFGEGYYKIRIAYGTDKATYDICRGVRYVVNITNVKGPGYTSANEAIANEPANIEYDITVDDGSSKDVIISNGKYYLGVSNSEYIVFADDAYGVTATTLSHNAPKDKVKTAIIQVTGTGITLVANQQGLAVSSDGKSAMIDLQTTKMPIKVDLTKDVLQTGTLTIRIGDLVKTIAIKKLAKVSDDGKTISLSDLGLTSSSITTMNSLSPRITVSQNNSLVVAKAADTKFDAYSYAEAFSTGQQGSIRIAVQQTIQNIVYYEQYTDDSYGFYFLDKTSSLSEDKPIKDTGYGVLGTRSDISKIHLGFNGQLFNPEKRLMTDLADYTMQFYPINHSIINPVSDFQAVEIYLNNIRTLRFIYPNFAMVIATTSAITTGSQGYPPFSIRTPKQFRNINAVAANSSSRYFKQERDLDFSDANIGGATSFSSAIISNNFTGYYDGGKKTIRNLTISGDGNIALFSSIGLSGTVKKINIENFSITATVKDQQVACLVAKNNGLIELIHAKKCKMDITGGNTNFTAGIVAGDNQGKIANSLVEFHETGYTINVNDNASSLKRVGVIAGSNTGQGNNKGIFDCCVVATTNLFSGKISKDTGGIVGYNNNSLCNCIYLAMAPYYNNTTHKPIIGDMGSNSSLVNNYYLSGSNYNDKGPNTSNRLGYSTQVFYNKTLDDLNLNRLFWAKNPGSYPLLFELSTPDRFPTVY